jgi:hypothetical protein
MHSQPDPIHTPTPALAGIVSTGRSSVRPGNPSGHGVGRILAAATTVAVLGGTALVGGAAARPNRLSAPTATGVTAVGHVRDLGPGPEHPFAAPLTGIAATPSGNGYWLTGTDGGVFAFGDAKFFGSTGAVPLVAPVDAIAATPTGRGYWLAARDGGVFAFGDAHFRGSAAGVSIAPVVAIAPTPSGRGYWLAAEDGGVFSFGDATFHGSAAAIGITSPIVGIASSPTGHGYWLAARDGGVFAFGDADFRGSAFGTAHDDAVAIAATGNGYVIARRTGAVSTFGSDLPDVPDASGAPTVGVAATGNGYWTVQAGSGVDHMDPFLVCTRAHESSPTEPAHDDGYGAINPNGKYFGAYQFGQPTWNNTARHAGRPDLVGVRPDHASMADQDALAWDLFLWQGYSPWENRCLGLR